MARINEDPIVELANHLAFEYQPRLESLDKGFPILGAIPRPVSSEDGSQPSTLIDAFLGYHDEEASADDANAGHQATDGTERYCDNRPPCAELRIANEGSGEHANDSCSASSEFEESHCRRVQCRPAVPSGGRYPSWSFDS